MAPPHPRNRRSSARPGRRGRCRAPPTRPISVRAPPVRNLPDPGPPPTDANPAGLSRCVFVPGRPPLTPKPLHPSCDSPPAGPRRSTTPWPKLLLLQCSGRSHPRSPDTRSRPESPPRPAPISAPRDPPCDAGQSSNRSAARHLIPQPGCRASPRYRGGERSPSSGASRPGIKMPWPLVLVGPSENPHVMRFRRTRHQQGGDREDRSYCPSTAHAFLIACAASSSAASGAYSASIRICSPSISIRIGPPAPMASSTRAACRLACQSGRGSS